MESFHFFFACICSSVRGDCAYSGTKIALRSLGRVTECNEGLNSIKQINPFSAINSNYNDNKGWLTVVFRLVEI